MIQLYKKALRGDLMLYFYMSMLETEEEKSIVEKLYNDFEQTMYNVAFGILHNKQDAEDAVHNAFLRIIKNISKISGMTADNRGYYSVIIVKNISIDMQRNASRRKEMSYNETFIKAEDLPVDEQIMMKCDYENVKSALSELKETDYEALYLNVILEQSVSEIADALGIEPHTVSQRIYRAKKQLRERMEVRSNG